MSKGKTITIPLDEYQELVAFKRKFTSGSQGRARQYTDADVAKWVSDYRKNKAHFKDKRSRRQLCLMVIDADRRAPSLSTVWDRLRDVLGPTGEW